MRQFIKILFSIIMLFLSFHLSFSRQVKPITWEDLYNGKIIIGGIRARHNKLQKVIFNNKSLEIKTINEKTAYADSTFKFKKEKDGVFVVTDDKWRIQLIDFTIYCKSRYKSIPLKLIFSGGSTPLLSKSTVKEFEIIPGTEQPSQIVYEEIFDIFSEMSKMPPYKKDTTTYIDLDLLFDKLKTGRLLPWIDSLPPSADDVAACPKDYKAIYDLLKFIKNKGKEGFEFREYGLTPHLETFLAKMGLALKEYLKKIPPHAKKEVLIECIGYADYINYSKDKKPEERKRVKGLEVYYDANVCSQNKVERSQVVFVDLRNPAPNLTKVEILTNNCQLSAVRAYNALHYLEEVLDNNWIIYRYAAGGKLESPLDSTDNNDPGNPKSRKIEIKIKLKSASTRNKQQEEK